jgi:hypothetical protein
VLGEQVKDSEAAAATLANLDGGGMEALTALLTTSDAIVRTRAAMVLGRFNRPKVITAGAGR